MDELLTMPEAEYRALDAVNYSALKHGRRSIAHMAHAMRNPKEQTEPMRLGTAAHAGLLEASRFTEIVAISPVFNNRTKDGKLQRSQYEEANKGKHIIDEEEAIEARAMVHAVLRHPTARALVKTPGKTETVAVWTDKATGLKCKARIDKWCRSALLLDLKTTRDASYESFSRDFYTLGYFMQAAWYRDGYEAVTGESIPYTIIAIENTAPHGIVCYTPTTDALERGRGACRAILDKYAAALAGGANETNNWPGYPDGLQEIDLPAWAARREVPIANMGDEPNW